MPVHHLTIVKDQEGTGPEDWQQVTIEFLDRDTEQVAVRCLRLALAALQARGLICQWLFTSSALTWRLRYEPASDQALLHITRVMSTLKREGNISAWIP